MIEIQRGVLFKTPIYVGISLHLTRSELKLKGQRLKRRESQNVYLPKTLVFEKHTVDI